MHGLNQTQNMKKVLLQCIIYYIKDTLRLLNLPNPILRGIVKVFKLPPTLPFLAKEIN